LDAPSCKERSWSEWAGGGGQKSLNRLEKQVEKIHVPLKMHNNKIVEQRKSNGNGRNVLHNSLVFYTVKSAHG
jgi:hypothetical protein